MATRFALYLRPRLKSSRVVRHRLVVGNAECAETALQTIADSAFGIYHVWFLKLFLSRNLLVSLPRLTLCVKRLVIINF